MATARGVRAHAGALFRPSRAADRISGVNDSGGNQRRAARPAAAPAGRRFVNRSRRNSGKYRGSRNRGGGSASTAVSAPLRRAHK